MGALSIIRGLRTSVGNQSLVKVSECFQNASRVKRYIIIWQALMPHLLRLYDTEEFSTRDDRKQNVKHAFVLVGTLHGKNKWVAKRR